MIAVDTRARELEFEIPAGVRLLDGVGDALAAAGFSSAAVDLEGGAFGPFTYVIPALSETPRHAAFYSEMKRPPGISPLLRGRMTYGQKDGERWFHTHGFWQVDGVVTGGHVIPQETMVAQPIRARALALSDARFDAVHDSETNFQIFGPVAAPGSGLAGDCEAIAVRIRPNEDVAKVFEDLCLNRGWRGAVIRGGVASTIGAHFDDGRVVEAFATEVFVIDGRVAVGAEGGLRAAIEVGLIDYTGALAEGRYERFDNPVLMTFEAVLQRTL